MKPIIAITAGDINGVGYEVIIKALREPYIYELCRPIVYGNARVARTHIQTMAEENASLSFNVITDPTQAKDGRVNLITCYPDDISLAIGNNTPEGGEAALASLERACADLKAGKVDALVTAPINKDNIQSPSFRFTGHTEYLTSVFGDGKESLMMLVSETMRVALVCNHVALADVAKEITEERILSKLNVLNSSIQDDFRIRKPRIAVLALNPHAGDNGLIGKEETEIIQPAIEKANEQGILTFGPYAADGFFGSGKFSHFDAVLAMYHDQGLIPFKAMDMSGVNYTAGLPVVRTSPDHGTAYDIAGQNKADARSFLHAVYMATDILKVRKESEALKANPLPFIPREESEERRPRKDWSNFNTSRPADTQENKQE